MKTYTCGAIYVASLFYAIKKNDIWEGCCAGISGRRGGIPISKTRRLDNEMYKQ